MPGQSVCLPALVRGQLGATPGNMASRLACEAGMPIPAIGKSAPALVPVVANLHHAWRGLGGR